MSGPRYIKNSWREPYASLLDYSMEEKLSLSYFKEWMKFLRRGEECSSLFNGGLRLWCSGPRAVLTPAMIPLSPPHPQLHVSASLLAHFWQRSRFTALTRQVRLPGTTCGGQCHRHKAPRGTLPGAFAAQQV